MTEWIENHGSNKTVNQLGPIDVSWDNLQDIDGSSLWDCDLEWIAYTCIAGGPISPTSENSDFPPKKY